MRPPFEIHIPHGRIADIAMFEEALRRFDAINLGDPHRTAFAGEDYPAEYLLAQALCHRVLQLAPDASEPLLLASRSQHLRRWETPRDTYPAGRKGYLDWRADLKRMHADNAAEVLREVGYAPETTSAVRTLNLKEDIKGNPDCQTLEDGLCLVFLQFQYAGIIERHPEGKVLGILRKTAAKMSPAGLEAALALDYTEAGKTLLQKALHGNP